PLDVMCHADTLVHPIADEDNAIALIRFESGAIGHFEVSWTFRGGMDLRDEVAGTAGTIWINHSLRTGFEIFTAGGSGGYVAEKAETEKGWLFPVGDEVSEFGYVDMFTDMFQAIDEGRVPQETLYDGYVVNAVMDSAYRSAKSGLWEPVELEWRGGSTPRIATHPETYQGHVVIKREILPDGRQKLILKDPATGDFVDRIVAGWRGPGWNASRPSRRRRPASRMRPGRASRMIGSGDRAQTRAPSPRHRAGPA
ncbi:MAG: Gfo/Idh/MocA family protein, partial [Candidatus Limnocylindrales bacterium]